MASSPVPVLISGGGIVGLSLAAFLAARGVGVTLVERRPEPSRRLRAKFFYARTIELYRSIGLQHEIEAVSPAVTGSEAAVGASLGGDEVRRWTLPTLDMEGISPCRPSTLRQHRLEELVRARATALGADLRFGHALADFEDRGDRVVATIEARDGRRDTVEAGYLVACDGAKSEIRRRLGIAMDGPGDLVRLLGISVRADVAKALRGRPLAFAYIRRPDLDAFASWDADNGDAVVSVNLDGPGEVRDDLDEGACRDLAASCLGLDRVEVQHVQSFPWTIAAGVAARYRLGRVFIAGDAAHVAPPVGGFGANTGIHDAYDLACRFAQVLAGSVSDALLDGYEADRRPVATMAVAQAASRLARHSGVVLPPSMRVPLLGEDAVMMGYRYPIGAPPSDPIALPAASLRGQPGTRAPHVWLDRLGERISTLDLFGHRPVLLGIDDAAVGMRRLQALLRDMGLEIDCHAVGADLVDVEDAFMEAYGLQRSGMTLVRADGHVLWTAVKAEAADMVELLAALRFADHL